ncbi:MAG: DUF4394 domain-containing protein [Dokdonella sp.]
MAILLSSPRPTIAPVTIPQLLVLLVATSAMQATAAPNGTAPNITVNPSPLSGTAEHGSSTTAPLTIGNTGNAPLTWTIVEAPAPTFASPFGANVPGYGVDNVAKNYFSLNVASAATLTVLGTPGTAPDSMWGAGFLNHDFSKEYLLGDSGFYSIDTTTGVPTQISASAGNGDVWAMTADPTTNTLYWVGPTAGQTLSTIDAATGATTLIGTISGLTVADSISAIAVNASGQMYGIDRNSDVLVTIDKATAVATTVGALGIDTSNVAGLAFDYAAGILYFADNPTHSMYTINTTTGATTLIGQIGDGTIALKALAIATSPPACDSPADVPWLSLDVTSGTTPGTMTSPVVATLDAASLSAGAYSANLCVNSNDPDQPVTTVPISFIVTADVIFTDGFDDTL